MTPTNEPSTEGRHVCGQILVPIPAFIAADPLAQFDPGPDEESGEYATNETGQRCFVMDACIARACTVLWEAGIKTTGSCCGHGSGSGVIGILTEKDEGRTHDSRSYRPVDDVQLRQATIEVTHWRCENERLLERAGYDAEQITTLTDALTEARAEIVRPCPHCGKMRTEPNS